MSQRRRRAHNVENASQTQVHHFDDQDDEEDGGAGDDDSPEEDEDKEDDGRRQESRHQSTGGGGGRLADTSDPYNSQEQMSSKQQQHDYQHQQAYDSMSTILEVDSEVASQASSSSSNSERPRDLGSPLEVQTTTTTTRHLSTQQHGQPRQLSPVGGLSPGDKFGGTLSALAAQMERLQRKSVGRPASGDGNDGKQSEASTSGTPEGGRSSAAAAHERPLSKATSAESLMMINISPMGSPRVKFPLTKQPTGGGGGVGGAVAAPIVEVSNKSTNTLIDLRLMEKMAEKYFVERSDKSSQSIKFDCDDAEFKTIQMTSHQPKVQTKSIAVGTEKFSRERFSLLPSTKTRSTQTKANMNDSDIGISETRRFKLSHLSHLGPIIKTTQQQQQQQQTSRQEGQEEKSPVAGAQLDSPKTTTTTASKVVEVEVEGQGDSDDSLAVAGKAVGKKPPSPWSDEADKIRKAAPNKSVVSPSRAVESLSPSESSTNYTSDDSLSVQSKRTATAGSQSNTTKPKEISANKTINASSPSPQPKLAKTSEKATKDNKTMSISFNEQKKVEEDSATAMATTKQQIPSLKTELRVIIEFADSRHKQRNEMLSNSNLINGILNKRTEVSTSKHVAVSPRQVLERLHSVGQRHSLVYPPAGGRPLQSVGLQQPRPVASIGYNMNEQQQRRQQEDDWQEVSRSSVCNEIESDTTRRRGKNASAGGEQLIMSSDATFKQLPEDKSAIQLRSRATRREHHQLGEGHATGRRDRLLVESVAGFDESQLEDPSREEDRHQRVETKPMQPFNQSVVSSQEPASVFVGPASPMSPKSAVQSNFTRPKQATARPQPIVMRDVPSPLVESAPRLLPPAQQPQQQQQQQQQEQQQQQHQQSPLPPSSSASRIEFEEQREDRRRVTQNGRLVYDDRLREHHFESRHRDEATTATSSPILDRPRSSAREVQSRGSPGQLNVSQTSPTAGARWQQRQPATSKLAARLAPPQQQPPPALFADQTSNLSSDLETMDSGFVQSGAGSSSNLLNQQQQQQQQRRQQQLRLSSPQLHSAPNSPISAAGHKSIIRWPQQSSMRPSERYDDEVDQSLAYVDDDDEDDDFVDQLGGSSRQINRLPQQRREARQRPQRQRQLKQLAGFISPPPQFRNITSHGDNLRRSDSMPRLTSAAAEASAAADSDLNSSKKPLKDTELITRLTRCKFKKEPAAPGTLASGPKSRRRTLTKLEQSLVASEALPGHSGARPSQQQPANNRSYQFKAQVMFESDTDTSAATTDRQSVASSTGSRHARTPIIGGKQHKEMITKTRYSLTNGATKTIRENDDQEDLMQQEPSSRVKSTCSNGTAEVQISRDRSSVQTTRQPPRAARAAILMPNWDYSLKVNRMRGNKVDSKVNTFIKHSRQPSLVVDR